METARIGDVHFTGCPIPTQQIAATRTRFPKAELYYEIQLEITDVWQGLSACAKSFASSGLQCISMRYADGRGIFIRLKDDGNGDLKLLEATLRRQQNITIQSWTTVIC